jgi:hypothetical protein
LFFCFFVFLFLYMLKGLTYFNSLRTWYH